MGRRIHAGRKPARVLTENQISFDIISLDYLEKAEIAEQCYFINGQRFEVMVVPYGTFMPLPGRELLGKLQEAGVTVIYLPRIFKAASLPKSFIHIVQLFWKKKSRNLQWVNMKRIISGI